MPHPTGMQLIQTNVLVGFDSWPGGGEFTFFFYRSYAESLV